MLTLFLDESGCDNLEAIDPQYPIFGIGGPIFRDSRYYEVEDEKIRQFKREIFGSEDVILHSYKIRRRWGDFKCLDDPQKFAEFIDAFAELIGGLRFIFVSRIIDPSGHKLKYSNPFPPYELMMGFIMEGFVRVLNRHNETGKIYIERRGSVPDNKIRGAYNAVKNGGTQYVSSEAFQKVLPEDIHFRQKNDNISGLQIADMGICAVTTACLTGHYKRRDYKLFADKFDKRDGLKKFPPTPYWSLPGRAD